MVLHRYKVTWKKIVDDVVFVTTFVKDFQSNLDEVERVFDVLRVLSEHSSYKKVKILKIEEIE